MVTAPMRRAPLLTAGLIAMIAAGCTIPEDPLPPGAKRIVVHAVLDLGADTQFVQITYSDSAGYSSRPVDGAQVVITAPNGVEMTAVEDTGRYHAPVYRYRPSAFGVTLTPGATYTLRIHPLKGADVTGSTTVPQAAPVALPASAEPFAWNLDTLRLDWPPVTGAQSYQVRVAVPFTMYAFPQQQPDTVFQATYVSFSTHGVSLAGNARQLLDDDYVFQPRQEARVLVLAVDANFYDYYRVLSDPFVGAAPSHLTGAVGVFGSIVPIVARKLAVR
jgi:hypothetical protein